MTRKTRAEIHERDATGGPVTISMGANAADIESLTKKWSQVFKYLIFGAPSPDPLVIHQCYRPLLAMTLMHALELQTSPERISSHALLISLVPNFTANEMPKSDAEIRTAFKVDNRTVVIGTIPKVLELLPEQLHEALQLGVESVLEKSKEIKAQQGPNGIGVGIIFLVSPMCNLARLVPLGVEGPPSSLPSWNAGWKEDLIFGVDIAMKF